jgi:nucleotide-binding universal stress UspA family protein
LQDFGRFEQAARQRLAEALEKAFGEVPATVDTAVVRVNASAELIEAGAYARMLVVGRRGHGGFHGLYMGSVNSGCVAHADCPVLVVHEGSS